jgi:hypothetical protein
MRPFDYNEQRANHYAYKMLKSVAKLQPANKKVIKYSLADVWHGISVVSRERE